MFSNDKAEATCHRFGSCSNEGSQAGQTYGLNGVFGAICACTHGYAIGNILEHKNINK